MLTEWSVANFKSIGQLETLKLSPLTILAGLNSSGKSSVIQSLLTVAQTLASKRSDRRLLLNGEFVRLGSFYNVLHSGPPSSERVNKGPESLTLGFRIRRDVPESTPFLRYSFPTEVAVTVSFRAQSRAFGDADFDNPAITKYEMTVTSMFTDSLLDEGQGESTLRVTPRRTYSDVPSCLQDDMQGRLEQIALRPRWSGWVFGGHGKGRLRQRIRQAIPARTPSDRMGQRATVTPHGTQFTHFLPSAFLASYDSREPELAAALDAVEKYLRTPVRWSEEDLAREIGAGVVPMLRQRLDLGERDLLSDESPVAYLKALRHLGPAGRREAWRAIRAERDDWIEAELRTGEGNYSMTLAAVPEPFNSALEWVSGYFARNVQYLGPLREEPRWVYALPPSGDPASVGLRGEYTTAVLHGNERKIVDHLDPVTWQEVRETLPKAVGRWCRYFGIADAVHTEYYGRLGHMLDLDDATVGRPLSLADVGFGASQLLPIIVMALMSPKGATLIYEQPEIHLHPALQSRLADFFLSFTLLEKRCLVETHSEYLVNRLRRRIAESEREDLASKVGIVFVEKNGPTSSFREVKINDYGAITEWPRGFFDEGQRESGEILRAALKKRKNRKSG